MSSRGIFHPKRLERKAEAVCYDKCIKAQFLYFKYKLVPPFLLSGNLVLLQSQSDFVSLCSSLWLISLCCCHVSCCVSVMSAEQSQAEMRTELSKQSSRTVEEQKKREAQDSLVRRLQKRVLLLTKVRKRVCEIEVLARVSLTRSQAI